MRIEPVPTTFRKVASASFLQIPQFQRPYGWTTENVEEFWDDLITSRGQDYFLGSFVFYEDKKDPSAVYIVDGQQRIATLTIALCAIRDTCRDLGLDKLSRGIQNLLERTDVDDKRRFIIRYPASNHFLPNGLLNDPPERVEPKTPEETAQHRNYLLLRQKIESHLVETCGQSWRSSKKAERSLVELRDAILGMIFITLTLDNEDDAYNVFETLNSRGKDLEVSDLL